MKGNLVTIVKDGRFIITDEENLGKDDLIFIQAGDLVPADLKLVEATGLEADEFELTGEILPVNKKVGEQDGILYMGSRVTRGTGRGRVISIGEETEFGKVLKQRWEQKKPYNLHIFDKTSLSLISLLLPASILLFARGMTIFPATALFLVASSILVFLHNSEYFKYLLISNEQKKFEQMNIKIRDPKSLERMNEIDLICFDKTGVLTTRQMDVKNVYYADRSMESSSPQIEEKPPQLINIGCALCNEILVLEKMDLANPIDKALVAFAYKNGIDLDKVHAQYKRVYDLPFDSENRYMACGFERENEVYYFMKGDPGVITNICTHYMTSTGTIQKVDSNYFIKNSANIQAVNQNGDLVIALAYSSELPGHQPANLTFLCLLELENSLQPGAREIIKSASERRIRSILLTGDRPETAAHVGMECGITNDPKIYLTGRTIQFMAFNEVARQSAYCSVFARLLPSQKAVLIRLLQEKGHFIAMVGDGPNDGLALKAADIGISFVKNSSPIARRLSKILINDLADVLKLIEGSDRLDKRIGNLEVIRLLAMVGLLVGLYGWIAVLHYF